MKLKSTHKKTPLSTLRHKALLLFFVFLLGLTGFKSQAFVLWSQEKTARLYPQSVEGHWKNSEKILGAPEVESDGSLKSFSPNNSASYEGGLREMVISDFGGKGNETNNGEDDQNALTAEDEVKPTEELQPEPLYLQLPDQPATEEANDPPSISPADVEPLTTETDTPTPSVELDAAPEIQPATTNEPSAATEELESGELVEPEPDLQSTIINSTLETLVGRRAMAEEEASLELLSQNKFISATIHYSFAMGNKTEDLEIIESSPIVSWLHLPIARAQEIPLSESSEVLSDLDTKLIFNYSLDGENWERLEKIATFPISNSKHGGYFSLEAPFLKSWEDVANLRVKVEGVMGNEADIVTYFDSLWVETKYEQMEEGVEVDDMILESEKTDWKMDEAPSFTIMPVDEGSFSLVLDKIFALFREEPELEVELINPEGEIIKLEKDTGYTVDSQGMEVSLRSVQSFPPGKYLVKIHFKKNEHEYLLEKQFTWGVLALNFNKSIYKPRDESYIQMGVLDNSGNTICDSDVVVTIKKAGADDNLFYLSTTDGTIERSQSCGDISVTNEPDYFSKVTLPDETGRYEVSMLAQDTKGLVEDRMINDSFLIKNDGAFEVERLGATRIYPLAKYQFTLRVTPEENYQGVVYERVPKDFYVSDQEGMGIEVLERYKLLSWKVDWQADETYELKYEYDAPDVSPYLFLTGPFSVGGKNESWDLLAKIAKFFGLEKTQEESIEDATIFSEIRQWQIASDAVANNGRLLYGDSTNTGVLKFRTHTNPFTFNAEISTGIATTASQIAYTVAKAAPTRDETLTAHLKVDGRLDVIRGVAGSNAAVDFSAAWNNPGTTPAMTCTGATAANCTRAFDIEYESLSGRALAVYADNVNQKLYYCLWDGTSWGPVANCAPTNGANDLDLFSNGRPTFVSLKANPNTNEILLGVSVDVGGTTHEVEAYRWDGSSFVDGVVVTDTTDASTQALDKGQIMDVAWESNTSEAVVAYGTLAASYEIKYKQLPVGGSWSAEQNAIDTRAGGVPISLQLDRDPVSDRLAVVVNDSLNDLSAAVWKPNGVTAGWLNGSVTIGESTLENQATGLFYTDVMWQRTGSQAIFFGQNAGNTADPEYATATCTGTGCAFSGINNGIPTSGSTDDGTFVRLSRSPNSAEIMALYGDIDRNLIAQRWSGSAWQAAASGALEADVSGAAVDSTIYYNQPAAFLYLPYSPWSRNWRWTSDAANQTPASWLAAENAAPINIPSSGQTLRLRMNMAEMSGQGQTDTRKRLQYSTDQLTWVDVDVQGGGDIWRYANCAAYADNAILASPQLTGSTPAGQNHVAWENGTAASTNGDHNALSVMEVEYCLQSNGAAYNTTYYFRAWDNDQQSGVLRQQTSGSSYTYPNLQIVNGDLTVAAVGTQSSSLPIPSANQHIGGAFTLTASSGQPETVTGITIAEQGTVNAQTALSNIKLFYEIDTVAPYDCVDEIYDGTETQFGTTQAFNAANGTATFTGTVNVPVDQAMCVYPVLDVLGSAVNGQTIEIQITNPSINVTISSGTLITPASVVDIPGTTTLSLDMVVSGTSNLTTGTVAVAVNGTIQAGRTGIISSGTWSVSITKPAANAVVTVFVNGAATANESTAVAKYSGSGNIGDMVLDQHVLAIGGSGDQTFTLSDLSLYMNNNDEDVVHRVVGSTLNVDGGANYSDEKIVILESDSLSLNTTTVNTIDLEIAGTLVSGGASIYNIYGSWLNTGVFTADSSTVNFLGTTAGLSVSDGGSPFYNLNFNGSGGQWLYQDGSVTVPNQTTVQAGTPTFLNAKTGTLSVTGGTLNVDWYLGIHAVDSQATSTNIDTPGSDIIITESGSAATVWKHNGTDWGTAASTQTTDSEASGRTPQPNDSGAIRIREFSMTNSATCPGAGCILYKYNLHIGWVDDYGEYDYFDDYGSNYLTSCRSGLTNACLDDSADDDAINVTWYRVSPGVMNSPYSTVNEPPNNGSWYAGMMQGLSVSLDSFSVNFGNLNPGGDPINNNNILTVTTSATNGYVINAKTTQTMACSDAAACSTATIADWVGTNVAPTAWPAGNYGFGYSTDDLTLSGGIANRFSGPNYSGFIHTGFGEVVADRNSTECPCAGQQNAITYRLAPIVSQKSGPYQTTVLYMVTPNY